MRLFEFAFYLPSKKRSFLLTQALPRSHLLRNRQLTHRTVRTQDFPDFWGSGRITGNPNLTPLLPTHIVRRGRSPIVAIDELRMGLRPTHRDENRFEPKPLRLNWRGTAKTGATLDLLRPMTSLVWAACLNQSVSRHPSRWDGW